MNQNDKIERYLEGLMSDNEKEEFEKLLKKDWKTRKELLDRKKLESELEDYFGNKDDEIIVNEAIEDIHKYATGKPELSDPGEMRLRNSLRRLSGKDRPGISRGFYLSLAAVILLFIIIGTGIIRNSYQNRKIKLFTEIYNLNFNPEKDKNLTTLDPGIFQYKNGYLNNDSLIMRFGPQLQEDALRGSELSADELLFLGLYSMQEGHWNRANYFLSTLVNDSSAIHCKVSRYYYSLSLLRSGKKNEASRMLEGIIESGSPYAEKASAILESFNVQ